MRAMPRDEGVTAETDPEPMRWTFDDNQEAEKSDWGMIQLRSRYVPYVGRTTMATVPTGLSGLIQKEPPPPSLTNALIVIKSHAADGSYVANKALCILAAQKLCGR